MKLLALLRKTALWLHSLLRPANLKRTVRSPSCCVRALADQLGAVTGVRIYVDVLYLALDAPNC